MSLPTTSAIILLLTSSVHAQITYRRRRTSIGRIIVGCVIGEWVEAIRTRLFISRHRFSAGGLAGIFFLCLLMMLLRRRRFARRTMANIDGQYRPPPQKPMFGGFWGQSNGNNGTYSNQNSMNSTPNYPQQQSTHGGMSHHGQQASYDAYPNAHPPAPPAYDNDKQGNYAPVSVTSLSSVGPF